MWRILTFIFILVTGILPLWSEEEGFSLELRGLTGTDLQWTVFESFPWGQSATLAGELTASFRSPWWVGFGVGGTSAVTTGGYTGTSLIYRSTILLEGFLLGFGDWKVGKNLLFRIAAGPSLSSVLFHREKSFTHGAGFRLDPQWAFREELSGRVLVLGLPLEARNLMDGSRQVSLGLRIGFRLSGGLGL